MGVALIIKTREAWIEQARPGVALSEKYPDKNLREMFEITRQQEDQSDYKSLCLMVEAFIALGVPVDAEVRRLAQIVSVNEALGLP